MGHGRRRGDVEAVVGGEIDLHQPGAASRRERTRVLRRLVAVVADPQPEVEAVGIVAEVEQDVPEGEGVLSTRHRHEHTLTATDHREVVDRAAHLLTEMMEETVPAEPRVVASDLDHGRPATAPALQQQPPEITGRISTSS